MPASAKTPASAKIQEAARQEVSHVAKLAEEGARSGAYLYPLRGIWYLATHKDLYKPLLRRLAPTATLGLGVTSIMFLFTYLPQAAILVFTSGPVAALTSALLVLSESSTITMVLSKFLLIEDSLIDTFDGTLVAQNQSALVAKERQVSRGTAGQAINRLGKLVSKPFQRFSVGNLVRYFMYLPLNFIPIVGTAMFVALQGRKVGPNAHQRYFQLKGMSNAQREEFIEQRKGAYTSFGIVAVLLEMVPVAGVIFAFSNTCGAALWAADMENKQGTSTELRTQAKKAE